MGHPVDDVVLKEDTILSGLLCQGGHVGERSGITTHAPNWQLEAILRELLLHTHFGLSS